MLKLDLGIVNFTKGSVKKKLIERSVFNTLKILGVKGSVEVSVVFVGDKKMQTLNRAFRKKDRSTDVLSFGFEESRRPKILKDASLNLGEIVISLPYAKRQAKKEKKSIDSELALLASHGTIHIFGIDHERSEKESKETDNIQKKVLNILF
ncbi:rRNA maturation RNase YbeY [Candidatus Azambacteria bacterium]|nr:rRNA maturation RNase YbeY [Candidatus Azambacteria bacterium]